MIAALLCVAQAVWAEDPALKKAAAFTVDDRGRVYVLEAPHGPAAQAGTARVLRYADADGDGRAEAATVFAELPARWGGGILAAGDELWVATDPSIWVLRDRDGDGRADAPKPMFTGFGARATGTGLRGPAPGPDGKLYFASGDRGFVVATQDGDRLEYPDMGAVLRCNVDGSALEIFAIGLASPSAPWFDAFGELFVVDGARLLHVPEGSDHGHRGGATAAPEGAHVLPPVGDLGPSDHGRPFPLKPKGAGFERAAGEAPEEAGEVALDVVHGRLLRPPAPPPKKGLNEQTLEELAVLMGHDLARTRLAAQQELVGRQGSTKILVDAAKGASNRMARIHAIWGLGQLYTRNQLFPLLKDRDPEIRAQTARVLGDRRVGDAADVLGQALKDESPKVRRYAATALGKLGRKESGRLIAEMLRGGGDDPVLRHAGAHALAMIGSSSMLQDLAKDASPAVKSAVLVAMRRLARPDVDVFLEDPALAPDAARAIHDLPIPAALPRLAAKLGVAGFPDAAWPRALSAGVRLGQAGPIAAFAAKAGAAEGRRIDALRALAGMGAAGKDALAKVGPDAFTDAPAAVRTEAEKAAAALR
jgi:hypothetical protein